jgi:hypothetical protein
MIEQPELFVVAPFGKKRDGQLEIDFDFVSFNLIDPVARSAGGVRCGRTSYSPATS